jgi:hypothetical protein
LGLIRKVVIMNKLALLSLVCGMGILVAQEPPAEKKDGPAKPLDGGKGPRGGKGPFGGDKGPFGGDKGKFGPISYKKLLETNDKDKDGVLSKEELSGGRNMWDRWQKADEDKDGKLSEKEFNDYQKKLMERFKGGKRGEDRKKD